MIKLSVPIWFKELPRIERCVVLGIFIGLLLFIPTKNFAQESYRLQGNSHGDMLEPTLPPPGIIGVALHLTAKRIGDPAGLFIRATHPMGPAIKAGLTHGQEILAVDGMSIRGKTYREVVAMIRGEIGKSVILQVKTFSGFKEVKIVRVSEQMLSKEKQI